ncbi:UTP--glucose-1-phosphate uridylyltransferase [Corynebacterium sp. B5-R-101]|uniref:UTP--glucose-1-phosphate uridylyltransferase n=1 Tax=Corynebacterium intestinale TaxID=2943492 RepID=A0ABT0TBF1_9CORY|nr:UTP--glucose-1-phosphate uridylyltransferase [Corynebacterium intestinale]MCL8493848.1 UTP--glucose-1-phosphate uridylyltransferase [Corynebacterium intestinale]MCP1390084.1 UTP--glucose-1-phosphate uridylyltransferase [Corynebacterium intestinale]
MANLTSVRTVVVPAAGMGTRFLPATKTVPKELLPVVDTPGIEMIAEEAAGAGATRLAIVTSPRKDEVMRHFDEFPELVETLRARGKDEQAVKVERAAQIIQPVAVVQDKPLGLGHAVGLAEGVLDEDEDFFAVMLPDDVIEPTAAMSEMIRVRQERGGSVLLAVEVEPDHVSNYGVFDIESTDNDRVKKVVGMVEKPAVEDAPSNLAATGRYLLDRAIFDALRRIVPGKGGELQLTDAIDLLISEGHPVHVVVHDGIRHDLGNPAGFIPASVEFGLRHPKYGPTLFRDIEAIMEKYRPQLG